MQPIPKSPSKTTPVTYHSDNVKIEVLKLSDLLRLIDSELKGKDYQRAWEVIDLIQFLNFPEDANDSTKIIKTFTTAICAFKANNREDLIPLTLTVVTQLGIPSQQVQASESNV